MTKWWSRLEPTAGVSIARIEAVATGVPPVFAMVTFAGSLPAASVR